MWSRGANALIQLGSGPAHRRFARALHEPERTQRERLSAILRPLPDVERFGAFDYERFASTQPLTTYDDWKEPIERQRQGESAVHRSCRRFQPTSGSTRAIKWIPYSEEFLAEMDAALGPWLCSQAAHSPGILEGRQYWSLSWIPEEQRRLLSSSDDRDFFPLWRRLLWSATQVGHPAIARVDSFDAARFATLTFLCASRDLSFLSVWSPTFALSLFDELVTWRDAIADTLMTGRWAMHAGSLASIPPPRRDTTTARLIRDLASPPDADFLRALWPRLALVSAWETGSSRPFAAQLRGLLAHASFEGKGLWATEGVVTIPYAGRMPVAITSHFYEFRELDTGRVFPSWRLEQGMRVQPVLTTGNGLLRYQLDDELVVDGFLERTPCLTFLGRLQGVDLVGEKLSPSLATQVSEAFENRTGARLVSLMADASARSYTGIVERAPLATEEGLSPILDEELRRLFHYELARSLGQLQPARVLLCDEPLKTYEKFRFDPATQLQGNLKIEPLFLMRGTNDRA